MESLPCGHKCPLLIFSQDGYKLFRCRIINCRSLFVLIPNGGYIPVEALFKLKDLGSQIEPKNYHHV